MRLVSFVLATAACGGSGSGSTTDSAGPHDGTPIDVGMYDFGCAGGAPCTLDKVCCSTPGATTTFACAAPASCPDPDEIRCDGPDDCSGTTPVCCGVYMGNGTGTYPQCGIATLGTSCTAAAACRTHLESNCSDTTKVQLCHAKSECTDATNNQCCTFMSGAASLTFCIDSTTAALGGATCL